MYRGIGLFRFIEDKENLVSLIDEGFERETVLFFVMKVIKIRLCLGKILSRLTWAIIVSTLCGNIAPAVFAFIKRAYPCEGGSIEGPLLDNAVDFL